ncbi:Rv1733c family protein [Streptomyces axinellae]|uniref:Integral membrane protein n=1 Tax=Streptomyces axinellae TaxID=552788 RepID=A0ABP6CQ47_9ACTN
MRSIVGLWRWRGNPLCRRTDRGEAWTALCAALLIAAGAPLLGWLGAGAAHHALLRTAHEQQRERHRVWATAQHVSVRPALDPDPETGAQRSRRTHVTARWTGPDGTVRTGTVSVHREVSAGSRFPLWTDGQGRLTARPMSARTAASHSLLAGLAAGAFTAGGVEAGRRLAVRMLMRRRFARWDEEWHRIGPDWGRAGTSN